MYPLPVLWGLLDKRILSLRMCRGNSAQSFLLYGHFPHLLDTLSDWQCSKVQYEWGSHIFSCLHLLSVLLFHILVSMFRVISYFSVWVEQMIILKQDVKPLIMIKSIVTYWSSNNQVNWHTNFPFLMNVVLTLVQLSPAIYNSFFITNFKMHWPHA